MDFQYSAAVEKFVGETDSRHDVQDLVWPGIAGIPAKKPDRTDYDDYTVYHYFHNKLFDLSNPEENEYYNWIKDRIVNGWFLQLKSEYHWEGSKMFVYLEWVQRYTIPIYRDPIVKISEKQPTTGTPIGLF